MHTISFHVSDEEAKLIKDYVTANRLSLSEFIKYAIFEKLDEELPMDEQRIQAAREIAKSERKYDHAEVWEIL